MHPPKLKILHVSSAKGWRGGERQLVFLVEELAKKNIAQAVLCVQGSALAAWCKKQGIPFFTYRKIFSLNPIVGMHITWICRRLKISHLHAHDSHSLTFAVLSAALFRNRPPLIAHRRVDFPIGQNTMSRWKYNHPKLRRIICVSHAIKAIIDPVLKFPERAAVVHDGIDLTSVGSEGRPTSPVSEAAVPSKGLLSGRPLSAKRPSPVLIGNVAALAPHKDYFTFVRTAELLLAGGLSAKFQIIGGDGGEEVAVRNLIAEKGLGGHIEMLGFRSDVMELLPRLDLLLFTSKTEGLGTSLLDAMAARVPIVATRAGGIPEAVEHGATGLLAPVGDAEELAAQVRLLLSDASLRENILANAERKVKQFSKEIMAEKVLSHYTMHLSGLE